MQKSFLLGVSVGESFAEYTLLSESKPIAHKRAYLSRESLKQSLQQFISDHSESTPRQVFVSLRLPRKLLNFQLSGAVAHITTEGFEHWLNICSSGTQELTNKDLLFSLRERILADGTVELPLDLSELEGVAEKIKLKGVKKVCLHLLHSCTYPEHAKKAQALLEEKGLEVFLPEKSDSPDEVHRWNKNALNATISGIFADRKAELLEALSNTLSPDCIHFLTSEGKLLHHTAPQEVGSLFSASTAIGQSLSGTDKSDVLFLGLEHFLLISGSEWDKTWVSPWGPVEAPHLQTKELSIQPTSGITLNNFGRFDFAANQEGWEPGPMFLGRGQKLSLLDLWAENAKLATVQGLEDRISAQGIQRFKNSLYALSKISKSRDNEVSHLTKEMQSLALQRLAIEAIIHRQRKKMVVTGPLASVFSNVFKKDPYTVVVSQEFSESQAIALQGARALQETL